MRIRQPGVEREEGTFTAKAMKKVRKTEDLERAAVLTLRQLQDVEGEDAGLLVVRPVGGDDADQHQQRAKEGVEEELHRGVDPVRAAPDPDQQRHRNQHQLPEDVEEEHVEGDEDPQHPGLEEQDGDVVLAHRVLTVSHDQMMEITEISVVSTSSNAAMPSMPRK